MDRSDAKVKFQDADRLFQSQQFTAALAILEELNRAFPDERHILYPMARALTGLKRYGEARELARRLATEFNYLPAQDLIDRIDRLQAANEPDIETPVLPSGMDDIVLSPASFGAKKSPPPLETQQQGVDTWQPYVLWIALVLVGFVGLVAVTLTLGRPMIDWFVDYFRNVEQYSENPDLAPALPVVAYAYIWVANFLYGLIIGSLCGYFSLRVIGALRFGDFGPDMKDVALYAVICNLLAIIPVLGWIAALVILKRHYELTFGKLVGVVLLYWVFLMIAGVVIGGLYYGIIIVYAI